jgi:hypothetical protein
VIVLSQLSNEVMIMRLELEKGGRAEAGEAEGRGRVITNHRESLTGLLF